MKDDLFTRLAEHGLQRGRPKKVAVGDLSERPVTLKELGLTKQQAYEWKQLAQIPHDVFEEILAERRGRGRMSGTRAIIHEYRRRGQQPAQQVNGYLALVRAWNKATDADRSRFVDAIKQLLELAPP